jgi:hypothetical protein
MSEVETLKLLAIKALKFQQYILRRAWGLYYAVWSLSFVLWLILPYSVSIFYPKAGFYAYLFAYSLPALVGMVVTNWIFRRARRTIELRRLTFGRSKKSAASTNLIPWLIFFAIILSAFIFPNVTFYYVYSGFLVILDYFIYKTLRYSFERIPVEGYIAIATFTLSVAITAIALTFTKSYFIFILGWTPSIAGWLFSSIYSLYHAPESMVE